MKTFYIKTHGCKSNQLESTVIKEKLTQADFTEAKSANDADIYILNSCSVTETADIEALRTIRNLKNKHPEIFTVLTGCSAQLNSEKISELDYVDLILGNDDKFKIIEYLKNKKNQITDIFSVDSFNNQFIHDYSKTRGYLKIQDGCNNYCSYCTIPYARGNSRSNSAENIIEQVKLYTDIGIKEVVLTGIHIGQWGLDFNTPKKLKHLLEKIEETDIERYRLGSLNTLETDTEMLEFLSQSKKFCPHFHLSLQSLTDKTLSNMNRNYTADSCLELMEQIDSMFKIDGGVFLGSDIIVGFPDETEADFETTIENVKKSKLSNIHVFPYSIRKNTKASMMKNQLPEKEKRERAGVLQAIAKEKFKDFINKNIGTTHNVLIEKRPDKKTGMLKGVTENYLDIQTASADTTKLNTIQKVKITSYDENNCILHGEIQN